MSKRAAMCGGIVFAGVLHVHQVNFHGNQRIRLWACSSAPMFSSFSRNSSSFHNYYLRRRRKCPLRPYKTQWHQTFAHQLAIQSFKQSAVSSEGRLLDALIESFSTYKMDPSAKDYHCLLRFLIRKPACPNHQIPRILDHIEKAENFETPECLIIDLIGYYGCNNMLNDAVELFLRMPKLRCHPSANTLNALLTVICRQERGIEIVPQILLKLQAMNIRIEGSSYRILIRALCKSGRASYAFELLNYMDEEGFCVDDRTCSLMLRTVSNQMDVNGGEVMSRLDYLKTFGFEPRKDDFSNFLRLMVKRGKSFDALEVLKKMRSNGVQPDIMCYKLVLYRLAIDRDFLSADKVFDELLLAGLVPDTFTYNVYITCLCMLNKVEDGIKMMALMADLGHAPELSTCSIICKALCQAGEPSRARDVLGRRRQKGVCVNS